ncbi:hypothetical protein MKW94_007949, partial [Papaver nudicaule]|nr:hypothetical protein [Papaver nudicaule]
MLPSSNNEDLGVRPASTPIMVPVNNSRSSKKRPPLTSNRVYDKEKLGKGPASTSTRVPISNEENLGKGLASTANRVHLNNNENS